jgi:hypothetical protein
MVRWAIAITFSIVDRITVGLANPSSAKRRMGQGLDEVGLAANP